MLFFSYTDTYPFICMRNRIKHLYCSILFMYLILSWGLTMDSLSSVLPEEYIGLMMTCDKYGLSKFYFTWGVRGHLWGGNSGLQMYTCMLLYLCVTVIVVDKYILVLWKYSTVWVKDIDISLILVKWILVFLFSFVLFMYLQNFFCIEGVNCYPIKCIRK